MEEKYFSRGVGENRMNSLFLDVMVMILICFGQNFNSSLLALDAVIKRGGREGRAGF